MVFGLPLIVSLIGVPHQESAAVLLTLETVTQMLHALVHNTWIVLKIGESDKAHGAQMFFTALFFS